MANDRTTVLLGAGASVDAGLPTSVDLTQQIAAHVGAPGRRTATAFHMAVGAMIAHDTGRGKRAFDGIDVERLFAAIRMLASRDSLEIAPFVAAWSPSLESVGATRRLPGFWGRDFGKAISEADRFGSDIERVFSRGVQALTAQTDLGATFNALQDEMIAALAKILTVDPAAVDYLAPVLADTEDQLQLATLNYDLSVELLAERADIDFDTGIHGWRGGYKWKWKPGVKLRLLKLHGSLDWYFGQDRADAKLVSDVIRHAEDMTESEREHLANRLALVFGQGAKLRSDGPFLAMLLEFDNFLERTDHLVIAGYSFRDDHINAAIRRWFNKRREPRVTIINPDLEKWTGDRSAPDFFHELSSAMYTSGGPERGLVLRPGMSRLSTTAKKGLVEAMGAGPRLAPAARSAAG